jgi:DNA-binding transcriptional LysR family regulator
LVKELLANDLPSLLTVNNYFGVLQAVLNDLGIGVLPDYVVEVSDSLVRVLPDVESNEVPVFLAYPEELRHSKRIAAFRDFVMDEIKLHRQKMVDEGERVA